MGLKDHADTAIIITAVVGATLWMNSKLNEMSGKISSIEKEVAIVKTVLLMKGILPSELAANAKAVEKEK